MSDPALGLLMLTLIVVVIMMGFPTAFTLMGLGIFFGYIAFYDPTHSWANNRVFDLMVERTYGAMTNDVLISIPLFVLMGYVMERGALVDKMFYSIQLAFRKVPASPAVGDDHRVRGDRRSVDRQAVRGGDVPRLLPVIPVPPLYRRLGDDQSEDRAAIAGRTNESAGAGVAVAVRGRLSFAIYADLAGQGAALAVEGKADRRRGP